MTVSVRWPICRAWRREAFTSDILYRGEEHASLGVFNSTTPVGVFGVEVTSSNKRMAERTKKKLGLEGRNRWPRRTINCRYCSGYVIKCN